MYYFEHYIVEKIRKCELNKAKNIFIRENIEKWLKSIAKKRLHGTGLIANNFKFLGSQIPLSDLEMPVQ